MSGTVATNDYSNAAIFASETIATAFTIYLGESIIANELLPGTKVGWAHLDYADVIPFSSVLADRYLNNTPTLSLSLSLSLSLCVCLSLRREVQWVGVL